MKNFAAITWFLRFKQGIHKECLLERMFDDYATCKR
jgi:hypothetical protein